MRAAELVSRAGRLRALHTGEQPLVLPNVWDVASARAVARAEFPVLATSSSAVAASLGHRDDDSMPVDEAFGVIRRISSAVDLPITADLEAGYRLDPGELVQRLLDAGGVGCNLEDTDHHGGGGLLDADLQAARIAAVKEAGRAAGVDIVVNARIDVFRGQPEQTEELLAEALRRARRYAEAGADCLYPITLERQPLIEQFVAGVTVPVNILLRGDLTVSQLPLLGVRRISMGGGLFRMAYAAAEHHAAGLRAGVQPLPGSAYGAAVDRGER